jgi:type IV pilus assembly protein PilW
MSLVELMVGVALGLFIVAGAATVMSSQLVDTRRLSLEAQVQQDLRATSDIILRQIRRAGYLATSSTVVWTPSSTVTLNPSTPIALYPDSTLATCMPATASAGANGVCFVATAAGNSIKGFYLQPPVSSPGVIWTLFVGASPQALTDASTVSITRFDLQLVQLNKVPAAPPPAATAAQPIQMSCPALCADGTQSCWPTLQPMELIISITGNSISDPNVVRTVQSAVRIRNDQICNNSQLATTGYCPTPPPVGQALCPALP